MGREIKFRAWGEGKQRWFYGLFTREKSQGGCIVPCIAIDKECDSGDFVDKESIDGESLGQYTGLKDKNGTEIYEGDYVKTSNGTKYITEWTGGGFYLKMFDNDMKYGRFEVFGISENSLEIIGNIYEDTK